jgi:hypothetical protein
MPAPFDGRTMNKNRYNKNHEFNLLILNMLYLKLRNAASEKAYIKIRFYAH